MVRRIKNKLGNVDYQSMAQDFVISFSPGALDDLRAIEYLKAAYRFFRFHFDGLEVISAYIHRDETTPHLHIRIAYFDLDRYKFVQKELMQKGITKIDNIRDAFHCASEGYLSKGFMFCSV